ncbi:ATP-binding protein [Niveibacterium sp. 24ML]|uniref:sensor histidine kinase n=1 Tax=Niveibacterium sp. 24ML TaxID=2985512 RepID=UPI00226DA373|nr:ATP-binding protein [Niveibacterium sp. 24ML]MCX9155815.1 ATP-binding protein [Niveibacterium sp. 24ML]
MPRVSFRQVLLIAFLLIAFLLGSTAWRGVQMLEVFAAESRDAAAHAVQLTSAIQLVGERTVDMERSARQYRVLNDAALRERFVIARDEASSALAPLRPQLGDRVADWLGAAAAVEAELGNSALGPLLEALANLGRVNERLALASQQALEHKNQALLAALDANRARLGLQVTAAVAGSVVLALIFGVWLVRPLGRLERSIEDLGANRFDSPVDIRGPADLRRVGRRLDWLRQRLADLEADRQRVLRHVSHELKTPLASLHEGIALLEDGVVGPLHADQVEVVKILAESSNVLQSRIEALLGYNAAAFDARRLDCGRVSLRDVLDRVIREQALQCQARAVSVAHEGADLSIVADAEKLAIVFGNLLSNAVRFSPQGGTVRFVLTRSEQGVSVDCIDEGPGVAHADRARIFDPFYQGSRQPDGARGGSGIGLSIVREMVNAHGGRIALLPSGSGAHFRVELPHEA